MTFALLLVDLQHDYLRSPTLQPAAGEVVERAHSLLEACREGAISVVHAWTTVQAHGDDRMPHWKAQGHSICVEGTAGHEPPASLAPRSGERIVHKTFYSAFQGDELRNHLDELGVDTLVIAGIHLHGCVRATVLDAYQRGYRVWVADDAVASDDPVHAAITRRYLGQRAVRFVTVNACIGEMFPDSSSSSPVPEIPVLPAVISTHALSWQAGPGIVHVAPRAHQQALWSMPVCDRAHVAGVARAARRAWHDWQDVGTSERVAVLERLARLLADARPGLAQQMAVDVGKPIAEAHAEVTRSIDLLEAVAATPGHEDSTVAASGVYRRCPLGLVAMITPWNNPVAIPLGKLAPALLFGNTVLWKPAPPGAAIACQLMRLIGEAGFPAGVVSLVCGDRDTAVAVMMSEHVDAVTLSGSSAAGYSAQEICARRRIPLQAELGGNNAAIVWSDADLEAAAAKIVNGAFGFAGQRCTANRRVILDARCYHAFVDMLREHAANMVWGDPLRGDTALGPVISMAKRRQIQALVNRSTPADSVLFVHGAPRAVDDRELHAGAYYPPTIIACDDPTHEIVQEESFGPVLVVQKASDWEHALALLNDVRQGLVAALFSESRRLQESFIRTARAGILKIDQASAGAGVDLPFGGWKDSGVGPPEHGPANREFYTRAQAIYGSSRQR